MEEVKEFENSVFGVDNNGFISIPYCNYVSGNIVFNDYQFLDNLEETNQKNNIIIRIQDITAVQILSGERYRNGWVTFYWMAFSLRNGHIVFSSIKNNNEAKRMENMVRKYISDSFRCQIKKED